MLNPGRATRPEIGRLIELAPGESRLRFAEVEPKVAFEEMRTNTVPLALPAVWEIVAFRPKVELLVEIWKFVESTERETFPVRLVPSTPIDCTAENSPGEAAKAVKFPVVERAGGSFTEPLKGITLVMAFVDERLKLPERGPAVAVAGMRTKRVPFAVVPLREITSELV